MKIIDSTLLNTVSEQAKTNSRLRMNYNFHKQMDEPVQRLLNALSQIHIYLLIGISKPKNKRYSSY